MFYGLYTNRHSIRLLDIDKNLLETFKAKYSDQMWRLVAIPSYITTKKEAIKEVKATIYARRPSLKEAYKRTSSMACRITGSDKSYATAWNNGNLAIMPTTIL